ncbi:hypothetical protein R1flu_019912 [Riccia fluitans]|uniref:Uncharacterized protein n=1 Tax=Riccia fluitans TaxID=41844 RepID=A0ABD1ZNU7_9MARC
MDMRIGLARYSRTTYQERSTEMWRVWWLPFPGSCASNVRWIELSGENSVHTRLPSARLWDQSNEVQGLKTEVIQGGKSWYSCTEESEPYKFAWCSPLMLLYLHRGGVYWCWPFHIWHRSPAGFANTWRE